MGTSAEWSRWIKRSWFPIVLGLAIFAGYGVGKDRAMTENNRDAALRASQNQKANSNVPSSPRPEA